MVSKKLKKPPEVAGVEVMEGLSSSFLGGDDLTGTVVCAVSLALAAAWAAGSLCRKEKSPPDLTSVTCSSLVGVEGDGGRVETCFVATAGFISTFLD